MSPKNRALLALASLLLYALILRPPLAAVGPLLPAIEQDLSISLAQQGLLAAVPVFAFGFGAFAGPYLTRRLGLDRALWFLLLALTIAIAFRGWFGYEVLVASTALAGLAIAVSNVLLPSVIRERFSTHVPQITALFTTVLAVSASFAAAVAVPISESLQSWNLSLLVWVVPAIFALALWRSQVTAKQAVSFKSGGDAKVAYQAQSFATQFAIVCSSKVTWAIFVFFGVQSMGFYAVLSWLPTILSERGYSATDAGVVLGLTTFVGVPTGLLLAGSFAKIKRLDWLGFSISLITLSGFALLLTENTVFACVLIGLGQAATFPLSLTWISSKASSSLTPTLSAVTQGFGYIFAATFTFSLAAIRELTGGWNTALILIVGLTAVQAVSAFVAGGGNRVGEPDGADFQQAQPSVDLFDIAAKPAQKTYVK